MELVQSPQLPDVMRRAIETSIAASCISALRVTKALGVVELSLVLVVVLDSEVCGPNLLSRSPRERSSA